MERLESRQLLSWSPVQAATALPFSKITIDANPGTVPIVNVTADILGNGKLDVVTGHENNLGGGGIFWYEYPASGNPRDPWIKHTLDANASTYEAAYPFDVNGDGAVDLIFSDYNTTVWYENPRGHGGDPRTDVWTKHLIGNFSAHEIFVADLNGDGKPDIATNFALYMQNNPDSWTTVAAPLFDHTVKGISLFDSGSGLGAVDIVGTGNSRNNITWWENPRDHGGNATTDLWIPHVISLAYVPRGDQINDPGLGVSFAMLDVNGDGRMDVVTADGEAQAPLPAGGLMWWEAPADRRNGTWIPHTIDADVQLVHNIRVADVNGDGTPDLVIFEQDQSAQQRLMIVYNEGGTGQNWLEQTLATTGGHNEWVTDVNGDGDLDIVNSRHGFYSQINPIELWMNGLVDSGAQRVSITSAPADVTTTSGSVATFQVSASGSGPLAFQWQRDGLDIPGATSSAYTIGATTAADNGAVFRCMVSNLTGFVASPGARLTLTDVLPVPVPPTDDTAPTATLSAAPPADPPSGVPFEFGVTYSDDVALDASTLGNGNLLVTGPGGYSQTATLVSMKLQDALTLLAVYRVMAPASDGTYSISTGPAPVADTSSNVLAPALLGQFSITAKSPPPDGANLTATLVGKMPAAVLGGSPGVVRIRIKNAGKRTARGTISNSLFFSADGTLASADALIKPTSGAKFYCNLQPGASEVITAKFAYPTDLVTGSYRLGAWINSSNSLAETNQADNTASSSAVMIGQPQVSISGTFAGKPPASWAASRGAPFVYRLNNLGNVPLTGKVSLSVFETTDQELDDGYTLLGTTSSSKLNLKPGQHVNIRIVLKAPGAAISGDHFLGVIARTEQSGGATTTSVASTATHFP